MHFGADTVMDLSTGGGIDEIREAILAASPVPIGTVPIYQALQAVEDVADITPQMLLDNIEHQAQQGVDYMTVHCGVLREYIPLAMGRVTGIVSRGGSLLAAWMLHQRRAEPPLHALRRAARDRPRVTTSRSRSATACGPAPWPTPPTGRSSPSCETLGELTDTGLGAATCR